MFMSATKRVMMIVFPLLLGYPGWGMKKLGTKNPKTTPSWNVTKMVVLGGSSQLVRGQDHTPLCNHFRPFGRGPTTPPPPWGRKRSPWLLRIEVVGWSEQSTVGGSQSWTYSSAPKNNGNKTLGWHYNKYPDWFIGIFISWLMIVLLIYLENNFGKYNPLICSKELGSTNQLLIFCPKHLLWKTRTKGPNLQSLPCIHWVTRPRAPGCNRDHQDWQNIFRIHEFPGIIFMNPMIASWGGFHLEVCWWPGGLGFWLESLTFKTQIGRVFWHLNSDKERE